jgi:hypothetical protein
LVQKIYNTKNTRNRGKKCCGGAEESTGGDGDAAATVAHAVKEGGGEEQEDIDAAAVLPHAVALGDGEEEENVGACVAARGGALGSANRGGGGALRRVERLQLIGLLRGEASVRKDQVTRRDSISRRTTFDNWRFEAAQGSRMTWSVTADVVSQRALRGKRGRG